MLLLTYRTEVAEQLRGFRLGAADYICKPLQQSEVLARVRAHLAPARIDRYAERRDSELLYVLHRIPLAVAFTDERGEMQFVNDRFVESFGYEPHELAGPDALRNHLRAADHTGAGPSTREFCITCRDGSTRTVTLFGANIGTRRLLFFDDASRAPPSRRRGCRMAAFPV